MQKYDTVMKVYKRREGNMNKKILSIISVVFICMLMLFGCGKDSKKEAFEADFMEFCDKVAEIDANIKAINPDDENAPTELLSSLDTLGELFNKMSTMKFPQEYDYLVTLAEESGQFMNLAVENYHTAFESEVYDEESANLANEYYARAYKRLKYMITFMQGEIPDSDEIKYTKADEADSAE